MADKCWYCKAGPARPEASVYASLVKVLETKRLNVLQQEIKYQHKVFHIPRCRRCASRRRWQYLAAALLGLVVSVVLFVAIGKDADTRTLAGALGVLTWLCLSLVWLVKDHLARRRYPPIEEARRAGFKFGEPPPGAPRVAG